MFCNYNVCVYRQLLPNTLILALVALLPSVQKKERNELMQIQRHGPARTLYVHCLLNEELIVLSIHTEVYSSHTSSYADTVL